MMNKKSVLFFTVLIASYSTCSSQEFAETYISIQGTWDKVKDAKSARFGGNNLILNKQFSNQYFSHFYKYFIELAVHKKITINVTAELVFVVNKNDVDSIAFVKSSGFSSVDSVMSSMLQSTSGKWMPAKVNDTVVKDEIRMWIHIFSGYVGGRLGSHIQEVTDT